jgi:hypothetical protein
MIPARQGGFPSSHSDEPAPRDNGLSAFIFVGDACMACESARLNENQPIEPMREFGRAVNRR